MLCFPFVLRRAQEDFSSSSFSASRCRLIPDNADREPWPLQFVPSGLLLRVPAASWTKHAELGPGRFFLSCASRPWKFCSKTQVAPHASPDSPAPRVFHMHRCQLPVSNLFAMTHYALQGATLDAILLDLAHPPRMTRASWQISMWLHIFPCASIHFVILACGTWLVTLSCSMMRARHCYCSSGSSITRATS